MGSALQRRKLTRPQGRERIWGRRKSLDVALEEWKRWGFEEWSKVCRVLSSGSPEKEAASRRAAPLLTSRGCPQGPSLGVTAPCTVHNPHGCMWWAFCWGWEKAGPQMGRSPKPSGEFELDPGGRKLFCVFRKEGDTIRVAFRKDHSGSLWRIC